jgi:hypothetical protein
MIPHLPITQSRYYPPIHVYACVNDDYSDLQR